MVRQRIKLFARMAEEFKILDAWVGNFPDEAALTRYLSASENGDHSQPVSQLAVDMQQAFYDVDFVESSFDDAATDLRRRLEPHSFSASYGGAVVAAFQSGSLPVCNTVLLVWGEQFFRPRSVIRDDYQLHHLGRFTCDPGA